MSLPLRYRIRAQLKKLKMCYILVTVNYKTTVSFRIKIPRGIRHIPVSKPQNQILLIATTSFDSMQDFKVHLYTMHVEHYDISISEMLTFYTNSYHMHYVSESLNPIHCRHMYR